MYKYHDVNHFQDSHTKCIDLSPLHFHNPTHVKMLAFIKIKTYALITLLIPWTAAFLPTKPSLPLPHRTIAQFPVGLALENIAIRPNGNLLVTSLTPNASLYEISNPSSPSPVIALLHTNPNVTSLLGITEISPDIYAFVAGSFTSAGGMRGSYSVWTADLSCRRLKISLVTAIPEAELLNGVTAAVDRGVVLIADSPSGTLFRVDLREKTYSVAAALPEMSSGQPGNPFAMGINGVHVRKGYLYGTNDFRTLFYRVEISDSGFLPAGVKAELVANVTSLTKNVDDFIFGPGEGDTAFVATNSDNLLLAVGVDGGSEVVLGSAGDGAVAGGSAMKFGRGKSDRGVLYVTTGGARIDGTVTGGKVEGVEVVVGGW